MVDHLADKLMRLRRACRLNQISIIGIGATVFNVVARRSVEHRGFLRDHTNLTPQAFLCHIAHILPINQNSAFFGVIEP